jgi:hypothetical protein
MTDKINEEYEKAGLTMNLNIGEQTGGLVFLK